MKKIFSTVLLIAGALMFTGCAGEEEDLFEKSAAERLNETSKIYTARLQSSEAGWVMEYYPTNTDEEYKGRGYVILADFDKDESVTLAMNNVMSDDVYMEGRSLWEIIADNGPVLTFNTYNEVLHCFSNPEYYESGKGFEGDYEFVMIDVPEDGQFIMLKGKKRGTYVRLTRLPDGTNFEEYLADIKAFHNRLFPASAINENVLQIGDKKYLISNANSGLLNMYPRGGDAITETTTHPFLITKRDGDYYLRFRDAFEHEEMKGTLQELRYDPVEEEFVCVDNDQFRISGYEPGRFYGECIAEGRSWSMLKSADMSDKFKAYIDEIDANFASTKDSRNRPYTFVGISLGRDARSIEGVRDTVNCCNIIYRTPGSSRNVQACYVFDMKNDDESVTYQYQKPRDTSSENVKNSFKSIQELMSLLSRKFIVSAFDSKFNLTRVKLTSADDPDIWFVVNI